MVINPDGTIQFEPTNTSGMRGGASAASAADLPARNEAARLAKYGPEQVARMKAAGATFGGATAAPSVATAVNPAPVATATAASSLSFGQRALRALRTGARGLGLGAGVVQAGIGVKQAAEGNLGDAADNVFQGAATAVNPVLGVAGNLLTAGRDVVMRSVIDRLFGQNRTFLPQATPTGGAAAAAPSAPTPINAEALMTGTAVPEFGTGAFRVGRRPAVAVDSRAALAAVPAAGGSPVAATAPTAPVLGTEGGVFGNLVNFTKDLGKQKIATATEGRDFNRTVKLGGLAATQQTAEAASANAVSNRIKALADVESAGTAGLKVVTDMMGNPIVVNTRKNTALAPTVNKPITEADIQATMKKHKLTREQVEARLRAEGRLN